MITLRRSQERGHFNHGWLNTYHTFSFGEYRDPDQMGFRSLRVINEDRVAPGQGFGRHPHKDMEIITYVLEGQLKHTDSLGNGSVIKPGDGQRMSAGKGILHSEFNPLLGEEAHFLQIWIVPDTKGLKPEYEQKQFPDAEKRNNWRLIASPKAEEGSVKIHQDVRLYVSELEQGKQVEKELAPGRHAWVQVARGAIDLNGKALSQGDGAAISDESKLIVKGTEDAEVLLFDLA